jgi:glycosyltransferase involved in cell wall biosynthesis
MHLLHVSSGNLYGGVERALVAFARAADAVKADLRQTFAVAYEGRLHAELEAAGADVVTFGAARARKPWTIWRARRELAGAIAGLGRPLAVIAHSPWALAVLGQAARDAGALTVLYLHNPPAQALWPDGWARRTAVDLVIANSRYTAEASRPFLPAVPVACLYPPVELPEIPPGERLRVRRELGTGAEDVVILQASRMEAWKGHTALVEALAALGDVPGWTAWIAGGAQRPSERVYVLSVRRAVTAANLEPRVRFTGERADIARLAAAADIYCQANRDPEPFGIAFVEALGAGLPVVTTAAGGAPEIVADDCGRLVAPGDAAALTAALGELIRSAPLRRALGALGATRARALCDAPTQLARLIEMLDEVPARQAVR